jgi:Domain of unknown function (DUF4276)
MKNLHIIVEGSTEENFVNEVLVKHFAAYGIFVAARKITTGWDRINQKPAKGGLLKYSKFREDILRWIASDRGRANTYYTSFIDLYAFPKDDKSPYIKSIQSIIDPYQKIAALETAILADINHPNFIPYVQLHEFETLLLADISKFLLMYPESQVAVNRLKKEIQNMVLEEINESPHTAPSKRIINYFPDYQNQKAQVGTMIAEDIGLYNLRRSCPHFDQWITKLENL